jgi:hypothetical protein
VSGCIPCAGLDLVIVGLDLTSPLFIVGLGIEELKFSLRIGFSYTTILLGVFRGGRLKLAITYPKKLAIQYPKI